MDAIPKKRLGRPPKATQTKCNVNELTDPVVTISSTSSAVTANIASSSECRRSSRQKKINPDVLNFLKKIPKQHKIQIEARIDSNAPTPKGKDAAGAETNTEGNLNDLTKNKKNFLEKSDIFRRISLTDQQNKNINATQILSTSISLPTQARRLSRTQEFFNATMMKSKQNSSLIVTKMESIPSITSSTSTASTNPNFIRATSNPLVYKQNQSGLSLNAEPHKQRTLSVTCTESTEPKRRGRPPKKKNVEVSNIDAADANKQDDPSDSDLLIEVAEDEKYSADQEKSLTPLNISENENILCTNLNQNIIEKDENNVELNQNTASTSLITNIKKEEGVVAIEEDRTYQNVVLEILSSDDETNEASLSSRDTDQSGLFHSKTVASNKSKQRNFAAVSFLQESPNFDDEIREPEFIVAAVEEIISESHPNEEVSMSNDKIVEEVVEIHSSFNSLENLTTELNETQTECKNIRRSSIEISDNSSKSLLSYDSLCEKDVDVSQSSTEVSNNRKGVKSSLKKVSKYKRSTRSKSKHTKEEIDTNLSPDKIECSELVIETYSQNQLIDVAAVEEIETSTCEDNLDDKSLYQHAIEEFDSNVNANSTLQTSMNFENVISIESLPTDNITISVMDPETDQLIEVSQSDKEDEYDGVQYEQQKVSKDKSNETNKVIEESMYSKNTEPKVEHIKQITLPIKKQIIKMKDIVVSDNSGCKYAVTAESSKPQNVNFEDSSLVYTELENKVHVEDSKSVNTHKKFDIIEEIPKNESETFECIPNAKISEQVISVQQETQSEISETIPQTVDPEINEGNLVGIETKEINNTLELITDTQKELENVTKDILISNQIAIQIPEDTVEKPHDFIDLEKHETFTESVKEVIKTETENANIPVMEIKEIQSQQRDNKMKAIHEEKISHKSKNNIEKVIEIFVEHSEAPNPSESKTLSDKSNKLQTMEEQDNSHLYSVEKHNIPLVQTATIGTSIHSTDSEKLSCENASSADKVTNIDVLPENIANNVQKNEQVEENIEINEVTKVNKSRGSKNRLSLSSRSKSRRLITTELSINNEQRSTSSSRRQCTAIKANNNEPADRISPSSNNSENNKAETLDFSNDSESRSMSPPTSNDNKEKSKTPLLLSNDCEESNIAPLTSSDNKEENIMPTTSTNNDMKNIIPSTTTDYEDGSTTSSASIDIKGKTMKISSNNKNKKNKIQTFDNQDVETLRPFSPGSNNIEQVISKSVKRSNKRAHSSISMQDEEQKNNANSQSCKKESDTNLSSSIVQPIHCTKDEEEKYDINTNAVSNNKQGTETTLTKGRRGRKAKNKSVLPESPSQSDLSSTCNLSTVDTQKKNNINIKAKHNEPASESSESDSLQKIASNSNKKKTAKLSDNKNISSNKIEKKYQFSKKQTKNEVDELLSTRSSNIAESSESSTSADVREPQPKKLKSSNNNIAIPNKEDTPNRSSPVGTEKKNKKFSKISGNGNEKESSTDDTIELNKSAKSKGRRKKLMEDLNMASSKNVNTITVTDSVDHNIIENKNNNEKTFERTKITSTITETLHESTKKDCLTNVEVQDEISDPFKNIAEFIEMGVNLLKKKTSETFEEDDTYGIVTTDSNRKLEKNNSPSASNEINLDEKKQIFKNENKESFSIESETKLKDDKTLLSQTENQLLATDTNIEPIKEKQTANNEQSIYKAHEYSIEEDISVNIENFSAIKGPLLSVESTHISDDIAFPLNLDAFDTPADTPIATPSTSPPPENLITDLIPEELLGVRRSHRIKQITKAPKSLVGRGLVRDKERLSMKDCVEVKSRYNIEDHRNSLADVTEVNAKFLKSMEQRLSNFAVIEENEYKCERVISKEARKMQCDCFLTPEDIERGEWACGEDCLNRLLMIECGPDCNVGERCTNKRFQHILSAPCRVFRTEKKGFGIMAEVEILPGEFIMEYVGEVIDGEEFDRRRDLYSLDKNRHYYFMALRSDTIIDATIKGNISRFINHSCEPNAETQKWTVNGEVRVGFFSRKSIMPGEEITFDYQYERYGREAQRCFCEAPSCRGWIGQEPTSDEGEQTYGTDDESSESETESIEDPMEAQKKLEIAAATANLLPIIDDSKGKLFNKLKDTEEAKLKLKNLLSKAKRNKQQQQKKQRKNRSPKADNISPVKARSLEDPDIEDEVNFLRNCGLKNQPDTLRLSRLMVRAKLVQTRLDLLKILTKGELPCRRLFLDYHGLRLLHGWMSENGSNMTMRLALLETLECLPIVNKTPLTDSKVLQTVRNWSSVTGISSTNSQSPSDESSSSSGNSQQAPVDQVPKELQKLAEKLTTRWESLPEIFRIPKRERIEQMKEHEREADLQYAAETQSNNSNRVPYQNDRFGKRFAKPSGFKEIRNISTLGTGQQMESRKRSHFDANNQMGNNEDTKHLSKKERREMFEAKMARSAEVKRMNDFETKCKFFGLDSKVTMPDEMPFCVNPHTGQWYNVKQEPIYTPPNFLGAQPLPKSTNLEDYELPPSATNLKPGWKAAITNQGKIYYYNVKTRKTQWTPPTDFDYYLQNMCSDNSECTSESDESDGDDVLINKTPEELSMLIQQKTEERRKERLKTLVGQREISPRRDEDRIYNQAEMRKYKENKEKIRKRKEEIRRKRANRITSDSLPSTSQRSDSTEVGSVKIQDYLLSSDEEENIKAECNNSPLLDKIVQGDKIVDELDALKTRRILKRPLPPHRDLNLQKGTNSPSIHDILLERHEFKKRKIEKKTKKHRYNSDEPKYRKLREKFRNEIVNIIAQHLKPYYSESCKQGRICNNEDYMHLARKLTHFVMIKEIKYCESVGQVLAVTESVINKSREFIKKYMSKYGEMYIRREDDPEFKDIKISTSV